MGLFRMKQKKRKTSKIIISLKRQNWSFSPIVNKPPALGLNSNQS